MDSAVNAESKPAWLDRLISIYIPRITIEHILIVLLIIVAIVSRFYDLGLRVMSHDEVNHVVPSYELYQGRGYAHDPVTHGPLQFHLVAGSYFLFGDSDFSSRIPAALFSIATIIFVIFAFRRYLGRTGALLAGVFFLVSPYMLFYGRYTRNEAFVALFGVVMLYAVLRYLEEGRHNHLYLYTVALALHFTSKETAFIYTAQILIFLVVLFIRDVVKHEWPQGGRRDTFIFSMMTGLLFIGIALGAAVMDAGSSTTAPEAVAAPTIYHTVLLISLALAALGMLLSIVVLIWSLGWRVVREIRSFDLLILTATMILPQLIAFPINLLGWNPLDYSQTGLIRTSLFLLAAVAISVTLGMLWKPRLWLVNVVVFYAIFTIFYTTFFTNGQGFFTGMVGSLGYWLSQQGVNRGSQPWYFFAFLQVPMYEYLPLIGTLIAVLVGIKHRLFSTLPGIAPARQAESQVEIPEQLPLPEMGDVTVLPADKPDKLPVLALLVFWAVTSLVAYTLAGEKMPWLTVHVTLPLLLSAGFGFGYLVDSTPFRQLANRKGLLTILLLPVFLISLGGTIGALAGTQKPFAGKELEQLKATSTFLFALIATLASGGLLWKLLLHWSQQAILKMLTLVMGAILLVLTARSAYQASFINYDTGKEFLVYAHAARGPKDVLEQVEEISQRTTGGKDMRVAYIGDALYPYWWYFREYPNKSWLKDDLTRDLLNYPVVISDDEHYSKTQAILKDKYFETKYKRLVWPMQDYFNMTWERFWKGFTNPEMRQAIFNIWLNKDYTLYASLTNNTGLTLENWQPSGNIYLFIQKDIVAQIWTYGVLPQQQEVIETDPYAAKFIALTPDRVFGTSGSAEGQLTMPHGVAVAADGSIYVADANNHRIQKFSAEGEFLLSWGSYATAESGNAPGGTFNEPWGIAVGADGSVYVADTWNHRVQKFTSDGRFITMWGVPGLAEEPDRFWGPRGIAVDREGLVYVTDTGNNRVVVFDANGNFQTQFGSNGINPGEFDEPVGIAVDENGLVYVADTWNQRIQIFEPAGQGSYNVLRLWDVNGWFGQSINNKPFLALDADTNIYVTDPDAFRVLEFDNAGNYIRSWGEASSGIDGFGVPSGIAVAGNGRVWVSDAENNRTLGFTLPEITGAMAPTELEPTQESKLPEIPQGLEYQVESGLVINRIEIPVYQLSADGKSWQPIIPADVLSTLPDGYTLGLDISGVWEVKDAEENLLLTWDALLLKWIPVEGADGYTEPVGSTTTGTTGDTSGVPTADGNCLSIVPPRLEVGKLARTLANLNMRSEPLIADNILVTTLAGETLKILGGPFCVHLGDSAYRWWQVENTAGESGWSAENFLYGDRYFLEPIQQ